MRVLHNMTMKGSAQTDERFGPARLQAVHRTTKKCGQEKLTRVYHVRLLKRCCTQGDYKESICTGRLLKKMSACLVRHNANHMPYPQQTPCA